MSTRTRGTQSRRSQLRRTLILAGLLAGLLASSAWAQTRIGKFQLTPVSRTADLRWVELAKEGAGDIRFPTLPDAKALYYAVDTDAGELWFRVDLHGPLHPDWFGVNVAVDTDADQSNGMNWWGGNQAFRFDRLVTVYASNVGAYFQGMIGVSDVEGINRGSMDNLSFNDVEVSYNEISHSLMLGVPRKNLGDAPKIHVICTVGSTFVANDDIPSSGYAEIVLEKKPAGEAAAKPAEGTR